MAKSTSRVIVVSVAYYGRYSFRVISWQLSPGRITGKQCHSIVYEWKIAETMLMIVIGMCISNSGDDWDDIKRNKRRNFVFLIYWKTFSTYTQFFSLKSDVRIRFNSNLSFRKIEIPFCTYFWSHQMTQQNMTSNQRRELTDLSSTNQTSPLCLVCQPLSLPFKPFFLPPSYQKQKVKSRHLLVTQSSFERLIAAFTHFVILMNLGIYTQW